MLAFILVQNNTKILKELIWDLAVYASGCESVEVKSVLTFHSSGCVYIVLQKHPQQQVQGQMPQLSA